MLGELFVAIEDPRFSATVNVVSGFDSFLRALGAQVQVQQLEEVLKAPDVQREVFERFNEVMGRDFDPQYENPWDVALAAYVWLLSTNNPALASRAAARVKDCPQCWWARKVAERVLPAADGNAQPGPATKEIIEQGHPL